MLLAPSETVCNLYLRRVSKSKIRWTDMWIQLSLLPLASFVI